MYLGLPALTAPLANLRPIFAALVPVPIVPPPIPPVTDAKTPNSTRPLASLPRPDSFSGTKWSGISHHAPF